MGCVHVAQLMLTNIGRMINSGLIANNITEFGKNWFRLGFLSSHYQAITYINTDLYDSGFYTASLFPKFFDLQLVCSCMNSRAD